MKPNTRIAVLPKEVADQIAAGEVVDRPLSIVKELVENSLDAGASQIVVEIKNGGKSMIRVTDDGCGIPGEEANLAFLRHATSKVRTAEDLTAIRTLGFRGEALSSIAAVSRVTLITRSESETVGRRLVLEGGMKLLEEPAGCPEGTTLLVEDLFFNTPARRKFLQSDAAESSRIIEFVSHIALAFPHVRIRLINNGAILFATAGKGSPEQAVATIYSPETVRSLLRSESQGEGRRILALHSVWDTTRKTRKDQVFFVNGRKIESQVLARAVTAAYRERIPDGRFPVVFLFLEETPDRLDVNIHPNKREVRFEDPDAVEALVAGALQDGLRRADMATAPKKQTDTSLFHRPAHMDASAAMDIKELLSTIRAIDPPTTAPGAIRIGESEPEQPWGARPEQPTGVRNVHLAALTPLGSFLGTYLLASSEDALYLIDQHAAHERVLYEQLVRNAEGAEVDSQTILTPILLELPLAADGQEEAWSAELQRFGFHVEPFGPRIFRITAIPADIGLTVAQRFLEDFTDQMGETDGRIRETQREQLIRHACHAAVKANDPVSGAAVLTLLRDLDRTSNPLTCPHGRPTYVKWNRQEIERLFRRT